MEGRLDVSFSNFLFYCWLHYTHQYMLCIVAIVGCTIHINTCYVLLLLLAALYTSIHAMHCCYCWLHYTHQYMLCIAAIVGCTIHINTCYALLLLLAALYTSIHAMYCCYCWLHYTHQYMLCIVAIVGCTTHINTYHSLLLLLIASIIIGSATASFENLVTLHRGTLQQIFY